MPQLDISTFSSQIFWLAISFVFLYFLVKKIIVPKAENIAIYRDEYLQKNISEAEQFNESAKSLDIEIQEKIFMANAQVEDMYNSAQNKLEESFKLEQEKLVSELDKKQAACQKELDKYLTTFKETQKDYCIKIAGLIIEKLTDQKAQNNLLENIYKELK